MSSRFSERHYLKPDWGGEPSRNTLTQHWPLASTPRTSETHKHQKGVLGIIILKAPHFKTGHSKGNVDHLTWAFDTVNYNLGEQGRRSSIPRLTWDTWGGGQNINTWYILKRLLLGSFWINYQLEDNLYLSLKTKKDKTTTKPSRFTPKRPSTPNSCAYGNYACSDFNRSIIKHCWWPDNPLHAPNEITLLWEACPQWRLWLQDR